MNPWMNPYKQPIYDDNDVEMIMLLLSISSRPLINQANRRRKTTSEQLIILERNFTQCNMPDRERVKQISQQTNMDFDRVKIWFQNRRAKEKRKSINNNDS